ncbi:DDRGK domain-containing protein 1 [Caenorhabditis elegans]|uniref:DDRGK domain-containing protein 1 n=2 Tax=Caenorhabditis elegans TaxID=6239 RepID=DDRGK_CAEEL|nr:DDRGK domain-containing protein 1 [Caenorhabditis elegans]P34623.3 RecName: Full=DDRGK domain-containing protein 1; AltName: Full=Ufm-binding protein 1; Flags: Precursor [Caenorhabditis elegans]CCF23348.1 DDRGK domain-containing protein 1 [Caenorhabditis elegans]|eukprot:NP_001254960.1 DDRGK domain-containing protein 1 [Caenorhabditis elegans]
MDPLLLGSVGVLVLAVTLIIWRLLKLQWDEKAARQRTDMLLAMNEGAGGSDERRGANVAGGMRRNARRRVNRDEQEDGFVNHMMNDGEDVEDLDGGAEQFEYDEDGKKIGKRKAAKLQAKEEKRQMREYEVREREERKRREEEREKKRDEERAKEEADEKAEEERLRKEREEKERKEHEEYLAMKASFAIEEEGTDAIEGEEAENLIRDFVDYVKTNKVVNIDELSSHFGLKSEDAVNRLQHFIEEGLVQGVMDDRGKFIYISDEEFAAVAKFINQRGRVSIHEIAEQSNRLIRLETPSAAE